MSLDKRIHLIPDAQLFVGFPASTNEILFWPFEPTDTPDEP
jgi:hypothetical protein